MVIGRARYRRIVVGLAAVASAALVAVNGGATPTGASTPAPAASLASYSASYGFPGHAGLYAYGMGFDHTDNTILVGDLWNYVVRRFTESGGKVGVVSKIAPRGAQGGIGAPFGVAADNAGNVWVADQSNSRVVEFSHSGQWIQTIGSGGGPNPGENYPVGCGNGKMTIPTHLVLDSANNVYVSDPRCRAVYVFNSTGGYLRTFQWSTVKNPIPRGVGMDSAGNVYVAEFNTRKIYVFNTQGQQLSVFQGAPTSTDMADVRGIAVDNVNQRVYAVGAETNKVVVFSLAGKYLATWSSAGSTNFSSIRFVTTDQVGDVYVSDVYGYVVWKFDKNGNLLPWSTPPAPPPNGGWNQLNGIAVDPSTGYLYGVDTFGNRVQVFSTFGGTTCPSKTNCPAFIDSFG